jgi:hypothetical protein
MERKQLKNKIFSLGSYTADGDTWHVAVCFSPLGELTFVESCLEKGLQKSFLLDAVAAAALNHAQNSFYQGKFDEEMAE